MYKEVIFILKNKQSNQIFLYCLNKKIIAKLIGYPYNQVNILIRSELFRTQEQYIFFGIKQTKEGYDSMFTCYQAVCIGV